MKRAILLPIILFLILAANAQMVTVDSAGTLWRLSSSSGFPKYDSVKGVVIYYDSLLNIKADSAILVRRADDYYVSGFESDEDKIKRGVISEHHAEASIAVIHYEWYDCKIILFKHGIELPIKQKIYFSK